MTWKDSCAEPAWPRLSNADGFVRLTLDAILSLRLEHVLSGLDRDPGEVARCGAPTTIRGFSEWASRTDPRLSLGWDWRLYWAHGPVRLVRTGLPYANVMLVDRNGLDYGCRRNFDILGTVVDALSWRDNTEQALALCTL